MDFFHGRRRACAASVALLAVAACSEPVDFDLRGLGNGFNTAEAARQPVAERPRPDDRGVISYPSYQVVVARPGDSVTDVASRVGLGAQDLASFNGLPAGIAFRGGEVLVLPSRVAEPSPATGAIATGPIRPGAVDVSAIAGAAIDRSGSTTTTTALPPVQTGAEPLRHRVERGETAFSIARLYNVSVRSLADWNGLDADLNVREGQYLLIPVAAGSAPTPAAAVVTPPGSGSVAPEPPSSATALPPPAPAPAQTAAAAPPSPALAQDRTAASGSSRLMMPVSGSIIRPYAKGRNDGIGIAAAAGTPVRAAGDGTVAAITRDTEQVPILVVRHEGNLLTVYAQIDGITVEKGATVKRGDPIGRVRAGSPSFLHFEVRQGFESVDPMPFLQ
jgi:murein DD-endopeptidase MepM/ murein hydrolase activator NlpD